VSEVEAIVEIAANISIVVLVVVYLFGGRRVA
jgi:hypothetical protein